MQNVYLFFCGMELAYESVFLACKWHALKSRNAVDRCSYITQAAMISLESLSIALCLKNNTYPLLQVITFTGRLLYTIKDFRKEYKENNQIIKENNQIIELKNKIEKLQDPSKLDKIPEWCYSTIDYTFCCYGFTHYVCLITKKPIRFPVKPLG